MLLAASLILALSLLAAATLPLSAPATPPEPAQVEAEASEEENEEGEGEEESESEEEAEEDEEEEFGTGHSVPLPAACILRSAEPSVVVQLGRGDVGLTLRYEAEEPTKATITYWLKGGKGSLQLGSAARHLGGHGALHLNSHLDEREMTKARAARISWSASTSRRRPPTATAT
jgi:hypothetical protein